MKHNFEERKQNRIDWALSQAAKNVQKSAAAAAHANVLAAAIPPGQPILIGHHSERRHRRDLEKIHNQMQKSVEADKKAAYYQQKAKDIEMGDAISSDDPQAIEKLEKLIATMQEMQNFYVAANKCVKKNDREKFLTLPYATAQLWENLTTPKHGCTGFPAYKLSNNNQNILQKKKRLEELKAVAAIQQEGWEDKGVKAVLNKEANRMQLIFPGKPAEDVRKQLRRNGFIWCRSEGAWQRKLNGNGIFAAKYFLENYTPEG